MISNQAFLFLVFAIDGFIIGLIFDFFRILRKSFKTSDIVTYIEDTIFWIVTGILILYSIFVFNNGEIRLFMFLGIVLGAILYILLLSQSIIKISVCIIDKIKKIVKFVFTLFLKPFKLIINFIKKIFAKPIAFITINIRKVRQNMTNQFKNILKLSKNNK